MSSSLKFGLIAKGEADLYPRVGPTSEWDTAAGHAVLAAAGGTVTDLDGRRCSTATRPDFSTRTSWPGGATPMPLEHTRDLSRADRAVGYSATLW